MADEQNENEITLDNFTSTFALEADRVLADTGAADKADLTLPDNPVTIGGRVIDAENWARKQVERAAAAGSDWLYGVLHPRRNPVEAAIQANGKRKQRLAEAEKEERWLHSMERVDVDEMYRVIESVGQTAYEQGVQARQGKVRGKIARLQPLVQALAEHIDRMPQDTEAQREQRMIAAKRGMQEIGRKMRGIS
jgi:hypothetical protein